MSVPIINIQTVTLALIDDDPIYQVILEQQLKKMPVKPRFQYYSNGPSLIERLLHYKNQPFQEVQSDIPDIILLDLNLPMLNGWEVLEEIRAITLAKRPKVYILSSSINPEDRERARAHPGIEGFLNKPIFPETLYRLLEKAT